MGEPQPGQRMNGHNGHAVKASGSEGKVIQLQFEKLRSPEEPEFKLRRSERPSTRKPNPCSDIVDR